ncbi:MAG: galactokinase [Ilumatobacteraceae bacterium]
MSELVRAPGRVNLIGDHTDYTGGLVFPMAIDRWTRIEYTVGGARVELTSADEPDPLSFELPVEIDPATTRPRWGRYVAAMAAELGAATGLSGSVSTGIPVGAGLSSSAALEIAVGLALGHRGPPLDLALLGQRAEHRATGVPTGIMDQLCIAAAVEGHAMLIDCTTFDVTPSPVPDDIEVVVRFVAHRTLEGSEYTERVAQCAAAGAVIGPLRAARPDDVAAIADPVVRARARHVVTENARVRTFAAALAGGDYRAAGEVMTDGHRSLRDDFATSTAVMDSAVEELCATSGVFGARMTGGGFGGCVVALCEPGAVTDGWIVRPVGGAARY